MKSKSTIIFFCIVFLLLSIYLPFNFRDKSETLNQTINLTGTLIAALASVMTLVIALLLYEKYGIDTAVIDKRRQIVFNLLEKINGLIFFIEGKEISFAISMDSSDKKYLEKYYNLKLIFSNTYLEELEKLFEISSNPFTPKAIVGKMNILKFRVLSFNISDAEKNNYAKLYPLGHRNEKEDFGQLNFNETTLYDFIVMYQDVKDATIEWISQNSSIKTSDLNV
jgi:fumarate reductase subunit D